MKVITFSSRPQTACFHVVNGKRTAVVNRKLRKYADESSCHAGHTMRFCRRLPSTVLLRKVPTDNRTVNMATLTVWRLGTSQYYVPVKLF